MKVKVLIGGICVLAAVLLVCWGWKEYSAELELKNAVYLFENDDNKALEVFEKYARNNNVEALKWLARWHLDNFNSKKLYEVAQKLFEMKEPFGDYLMGLCHESVIGIKKDDKKAKEYYLIAAEKSVPEAYFMLAVSFEKDPVKIEEYLKKAISLGYEPAKFEYGNFLFKKKRYAEAVKMFETSNNYYSFCRLANCYSNGYGVKINIKKAVEYAEKALQSTRLKSVLPVFSRRIFDPAGIIYEAGIEELVFNGETDFAEKCLELAAEYEHGADAEYEYAVLLGKKKEKTYKSIHYLKKAAAKGHIKANFLLGIFYKGEKKWNEAEKCFLQAMFSNKLHKRCVEELNELYLASDNFMKQKYIAAYGTELELTACRDTHASFVMRNSGDKGLAEASALFTLSQLEGSKYASFVLETVFKGERKRLQRLAAAGNGDAMFALSEWLRKQPEGSDEHRKGCEYFENAVNQKHPIACYILANMYARGLGIEKNLQKAMKYYKISSEAGFKPATKNIIFLYYDKPELFSDAASEIDSVCEYALFQNVRDMDFHIASIYENVLKDTKTAEKFLRLGASRGYPPAMLVLYKKLKEKNPAEAQKFLQQAIEAEDGTAYMIAGDLAKEANEPREAFMNYLYSYRSRKGDEIEKRLSDCLLKGFGCEQNIANAEKISKTSSKKSEKSE